MNLAALLYPRVSDRVSLGEFAEALTDISKSRDMDRLMDTATPQAIARAAQAHGARSVAFTYNNPVVLAEYAMDTANACHALGIKTVAITAGYMRLAPAREF